jgi:hypothetical protein
MGQGPGGIQPWRHFNILRCFLADGNPGDTLDKIQTRKEIMFTQPQQPSLSLREHNAPAPRLELNRLLATAVVDRNFRSQLLEHPQNVLNAEYLGQAFILDAEEQSLLLSIHAQSLPDLAQQLLVTLRNQPIPVHQVSCVG